MNDQTLQYVRSLERRLLEHELANRNNNVENSANLAASSANKTLNTNGVTMKNKNAEGVGSNGRTLDVFSGRPEAMVRAMQVLEVREQLDRDRANGITASPEQMDEQMDDGEKALLREMCNVVWRKLEDNTSNQDTV